MKPLREQFVGILSNGKQKNVTATSEHLTPIPIELDKLDADAKPVWQSQAESAVYAVVGQVLHESNQKLAMKPIPATHFQNADKESSFFSTSVPNIPSFLATLDEFSNTPKEHILLRLMPSPWASTEGNVEVQGTFPAVEATVSIDPETKMPSLSKIEAITNRNISDVMLPAKDVDLRFVAASRVSLSNPLSNFNIQQFFNSSNLNIRGRGKLRAPPTLKLQIPRHLIPQSTEGSSLDAETEMEYLFVGLDYRQTLEFEYKNWKLLYTTVEAGKLGGRRSELVIFLNSQEHRHRIDSLEGGTASQNESAETFNGQAVDEFFTAALEVANSLNAFQDSTNSGEL
jgi:hypothetical protein